MSSSDLNGDSNEKVQGVPKGSFFGSIGVSKGIVWGTNKSASLFIMPTSASRHKCQIPRSKVAGWIGRKLTFPCVHGKSL